jgi:hypothetical protein
MKPNNEDDTIRKIFRELEEQPPSAWDTPSEGTWEHIASQLNQNPKNNRPSVKVLYTLALLLFIRGCNPVSFSESSFPLFQRAGNESFLPAETKKPPQIPVAVTEIVPAPKALSDIQETSLFVEIPAATSIPTSPASLLGTRFCLPVFPGYSPAFAPITQASGPSATPRADKGKWAAGPLVGSHFQTRPSANPSLSPRPGYNLGLEIAREWPRGIRLASGLAWSGQEWEQVLPLTITYREDQATEDESGRLVRSYNPALPGAFGTARLDISVANARENDGADVQPGENLTFRVKTRTSISYLSIPVAIGKVWRNGPWAFELRAGVGAHANLSSRFEISRIESLRARIQPVRLELRGRQSAVSDFYFDAFAGARAYWSPSGRHRFFLQGEYRQNLSPVARNIREGGPGAGIGYLFAFQ